MLKIQFKKAKISDIEEIMQLVDDAIDAMKNRGIDQWDHLYPVREDFLNDIEKNQLTIGKVNDQAAVIFTLNQEYDDQYQNGQWTKQDSSFCIIHRLCVSPSFQNKGVATKTLKHIESMVQLQKIESIRLDVFENNPVAMKLYNQNGYHCVGYAHWRKGTFCLMEKNLTDYSIE